ncbi:pleiotropic regulator 1 [Apiospora marii]|uniref:Pre-mRNA-splicing factor PRP46 n=1 Tax=Apiospora marii TaxID=335849 RepID=A0ABR1S8D3_9PEZI
MEVAAQPDLKALVHNNARQSKSLFADAEGSSSRKRQRLSTDTELEKTALSVRLNAEYAHVRELPPALAQKQASALSAARNKKKGKAAAAPAEGGAAAGEEQKTMKLIEGIEEKKAVGGGPGSAMNSTALVQRTKSTPFAQTARGDNNPTTSLSVARAQAHMVKPDWHPPWKLMRVISGHLGWVRSLAVEPGNQWFASGAGDRTIKIWDLASGNLKLTLTGHISTVRGLAVSPRHPYLFSCGEDKMVKCWDLETNKVIRHYHGHLSGVYTLALHPTLDVLVTGGRDGVARVWDMRTRSNIHVLGGHKGTVADLKCQAADPQVITGSLDSTVRLWDLAAGKSMGVLTHHKKGVRALALHPSEFTFATGSTGSIKQWKCPEGAFMQNFEGHNSIINSLACNEDVLFSGGDNGSMSFWDWKTGHRFQSLDSIAQPGSLDAEAGIMSSTFDATGMRLIVGEADKTIKIWKQDEKATEETHPLEWKPTLGQRKF